MNLHVTGQNNVMDKVVRDGKVAVCYSPGYGAGFYTWNSDYPQLLFSPIVVEKIEADKRSEITKELLGIDVYLGGVGNLTIAWIPEGTRFQITEYDGYESVEILEELNNVFIA